MINRNAIPSMLAAAVFAGALLSAAPAVADPVMNEGNGGNPAEPSFNTLFGVGCFAYDANGTRYLDNNCIYHNTFKPLAGSDPADLIPAMGMYWDSGTLPPGAALPDHEITSDHSFWFLNHTYYIRCNQRLKPTGDYKSSCYFNGQTQKNFQPTN